MQDGRLTRLAALTSRSARRPRASTRRLALTIVALFLTLTFSPLVDAASPAVDRPAPDGTDGQEITGLAIDATGQFIIVGVAFDAAKTTGGIGLPTSSAKRDIYLCDYGAADAPRSGTGCRGLRHAVGVAQAYTPNAAQRVSATHIDEGGRQGRYVVAGPDDRISLWTHAADTPTWVAAAPNQQVVLNVSIATDGKRIIDTVAPASPTASGSLEVRYPSNGTVEWSVPLVTASGANVRPTALAQSRAGNVVAVGTASGVLLANPQVGRPNGALGAIPQPDAVTGVALSRDGEYVAAAAANGVFFAHVIQGARPNIPSNSSVFNRGFGEGAQHVAMSLDASRFAAAAGSKIHFFRRLDTAQIAEPLGQAYDTGARVSGLAYDERGLLLVAIAGNTVYGFGPDRNTPLWSFDATDAARGGLDGPLRGVAVSDDAQRIIVAGRTRTNAYSSILGVDATLSTSTGQMSITPTATVQLELAVRNEGSLADNYSFVVTTPVGWQSASADGLRLGAGESGTVMFNVTAPAGQAPGTYAVQARVRSAVADDLAQRRNQPSAYLAGPAFNLSIPRSVVLKVEAPDDRLLLQRGAEEVVGFVIRNEGNAEGVVNLSARQELTRGASWSVRFEPGDQVRVPASGSTSVQMYLTAPSDAGSGDRNLVTIRAKEGDTVEATDQVTAYVDAQFGAELRTNRTSWEFYPGQVQTIRLNVTNIGNTEDIYNLSSSLTPAAVASDWRVTIETPQVSVLRGQTKIIAVTVKAVASDAREASLTLRALSQASPDERESSLILNLLTIPRPPEEEEKDDRVLPMPGLALILIALAAIAVVRRPSGGRR